MLNWASRSGRPAAKPNGRMTNEPNDPAPEQRDELADDKRLAALGKCPACGLSANRGQAFCIRCGTPLERGAYNPFERVKMRSLLIWIAAAAAVGLILYWAASVLLYYWGAAESALDVPLAMAWAYLALAAWLAWQIRRRRIDLSRLIGPLPEGREWIPVMVVLAAAFVFSIGSALLLPALLSYARPELVEGFLEASDPLEGTSTSLGTLLIAAQIVVVAPIVEELLFRGAMLHRLTAKWGLRTALVVSSVVFGILHVNFLGAGVLGFVIALLYLRTRKLLVPIICHTVNNAVAASFLILAPLMNGTAEGQAAFAGEQARDALIVGSALLLLTAPALAYFAYRNWPGAEARPPYLDQAP